MSSKQGQLAPGNSNLKSSTSALTTE